MQTTVAKKVRDNTRKLVKPISVKALAELFPDLGAEQFETILYQISVTKKYEDIKEVITFTGSKYLFSSNYMTEPFAEQLIRTEEIMTIVVQKVREDSQLLGVPTKTDVFPALVPDLSRQELQKCYADLHEDGKFADIKSIVAFSGATYYYSDSYLEQAQVKSLVRSFEVQFKIVDKVRGDSKYLAKLTKVDDLLQIAPGITLDEIHIAITEMSKDESYRDLEMLTARNGAQYLVSYKHMSPKYAEILLRAEVNEPSYMIVETVRDESKTYPRPTNIEIFKYGLFNIDREQLDKHIEQTLAEYEDIRMIESGGTTYLYSEQYMSGDQAALIARRQHREN